MSHALIAVVALALFALSSRRLERAIKAFAFQSYALAFIAMAAARSSEGTRDLWILAGLTVAIKGVAVPVALLRAVRRLNIRHEIEFIVNIPSSLLLAAVGTLGAFRVGMAVILIGLLVMLGRKKVVTQIVGLLMMENGVILAALGLTRGMPLI